MLFLGSIIHPIGFFGSPEVALMPAIKGLTMKRVSVPFLIGAMLFTVIGLYGCASDGERVAPVDASIGIIETRGTDETSRIVFYDGS